MSEASSATKDWNQAFDEAEEANAAEEAKAAELAEAVSSEVKEEFNSLMKSEAQGTILEDVDTETSLLVRVFKARGDVGEIFCTEQFHQFNLCEELLDSVSSHGWSKPTTVQSLFLHKILGKERKDLIVVAPTGSGKTSGFVLCMLHRVVLSQNHPQVVCISPTMELAEMTYTWVVNMGSALPGLKIAKVTKMDSKTPQDLAALAAEYSKCHVIVCTPLTLIKVSEKSRDLLTKVNLFVLDEADMFLCDMEMTSQINKIKTLISGQTGRARLQARGFQTLMFSATFYHQEFLLSKKFTVDPTVVICPGIPKSTTHIYLDVSEELPFSSQPHRSNTHVNEEAKLIERVHKSWSGAQTMVFVETQKMCDIFCAALRSSMGEQVQSLHGKTENRREIIEWFFKGTVRLIFCTRVASRGLDIPTVSLVIIRDIPKNYQDKVEDPTTYLHMAGRTGRIGNVGVVATLVKNPSQMKSILAIQNGIRRLITETAEMASKGAGPGAAPPAGTLISFTIERVTAANIQRVGDILTMHRQQQNSLGAPSKS